jgi:isoquinoline 1-oxidoreductase alpha subunit
MSKTPALELISFSLNGRPIEQQVNPDQDLLGFLRAIGMKSVKTGCGKLGDCGMCTVLINGKPVQSCLVKMSAVEGRKVETLESLGTPDNLHPLQQAFIA